MKRILLFSFLVAGLLLASEPGLAGSVSGAVAPECPICLAPVDLTLPADNPEAAVTTTPLFGCKHPEHFHASCLAGLLATRGAQTQCPICRNPLLAHPGPNLPAIIQAALPVEPLAPVIAVPAPVPAHITHINQILHHYDAEQQLLNLSTLDIGMIDGAVFEQINKQWPNLQALHLSYNPLLAVLSPEIGQLHNLQTIHLSCNQSLAVLPPEIGQLQQLQTLDLSYNPSLVVLPPEIGQLQQLQTLDLSYNPSLAVLPPEIGQLQQLQTLDLSNNPQLTSLPPEIGNLQQLQTLYLSNTPLVQIADWPAMRAQLQEANPHITITDNE